MGKKTLNKNVEKSSGLEKSKGIQIPKNKKLDFSDSVNVVDPKDKKPMTVDEILEKIKMYEDSFESDKALKLYAKVIPMLEKQNDNDKLVSCLEESAYLMIEMEQDDEGKAVLEKCVTMCPDEGYQKYFFLGQLNEGMNSINHYRKGIIVIENDKKKVKESTELSDKEKEEKQNAFLNHEALAYCSIAELYMTDLCDEKDAEKECVEAIQLAILKAPENPQPWMTMANFHTIKGKKDEAKHAAKKCLEYWLPKMNKVLFASDDEDEDEDDKDSAINISGDKTDTNKEESDEKAEKEKSSKSSKKETPADEKKSKESSNGEKKADKDVEKMDEDAYSSEEESDDDEMESMDVSEAAIDLEEITGIPLAAHMQFVRNLMELDMFEDARKVLEIMMEEDDTNPETFYLMTEVGQHLNWKETEPEALRHYAYVCKLLSKQAGDDEMAESMEKICAELPSPPESEEDSDIDIASTDEEEERDEAMEENAS